MNFDAQWNLVAKTVGATFERWTTAHVPNNKGETDNEPGHLVIRAVDVNLFAATMTTTATKLFLKTCLYRQNIWRRQSRGGDWIYYVVCHSIQRPPNWMNEPDEWHNYFGANATRNEPNHIRKQIATSLIVRDVDIFLSSVICRFYSSLAVFGQRKYSCDYPTIE